MSDVSSCGLDFDLALTSSHFASSGLDDREVFDIARFASHLPGAWLLERNEDCVGDISAILTMVDFEKKTHVFYRENALVHLTFLSLDAHEHVASATQVQILFPAAERLILARGWTSRAGTQARAAR